MARRKRGIGGISSLTDDIMWDIFGRLPAKSIGRSRCVSKRWLSLTTDPQFVDAYSVNVSGFFFGSQYYDRIANLEIDLFTVDRSIPSSDPTISSIFLKGLGHSHIRIFHSCNGLVLCGLLDHEGDGNHTLCVFNPTTLEPAQLPFPPGLKAGLRRLFNFSLVFHPSTCPRFKIFAGRHLMGNSSYVIHRFSSETWSWRKILTLDYFPYRSDVCRLLNAYWNGYLCWIVDGWLQCLDVNTETMTRLSLPPPLCPPAPTMDCMYAGTSDGHRLHCFTSNIVGNKRLCLHDIHVYEMESTTSGWSLQYRINLNNIAHDLEGCPDWVKILSLFREQDDVLILNIPHQIGVYNLKDKTFYKICDGPGPYDFPLELYPHVNSLLSM